jgi:hypothetical protein
MPRSAGTINGCRLLQDASVHISDPTTGTGTINGQYVAGTSGNGPFQDNPLATLKGQVSVALAGGELATAALQAMCSQILTQEGLTQGSDRVFNVDGVSVLL